MHVSPPLYLPGCRIYLDRQVVNARFMALLQPEALALPDYFGSLCEVGPAVSLLASGL